jgi:hypothetical protein
MSYNLIEQDKDTFRCQETMGLVEFLRRVKRKEPLPQSLRVQGLDAVLEEAQDTTETAKVIRNLLAARNEYMGRQNPFVVFPMRADLQESGRQAVAYLPKGRKNPKRFYVRDLFGNRWQRTKAYLFVAGFNLTRG